MPDTDEAVLSALWLPLLSGELAWPADGRVLFLNARAGAVLGRLAGIDLHCQQDFRPFATALERMGLRVNEPAADARHALVVVWPPRQREAARALFARAWRHCAAGGVVLAAAPNTQGARAAEADLARLAGPLRHLSKHKCRVFWNAPGARPDPVLLADWLALDAPRRNPAGFVSRPGLFAWDRVDPASALLAETLPPTLAGEVADLGAGYGYLAVELIARCPQLAAVDLYEADARALEPARINVAEAMQAHGRSLRVSVYWHDVTAGLPRTYDAIVCNPPFHQGRADLPALGQAFIRAAADALRPQGQLWLVANRHLPYEATLAARFADVRLLAERDGFKALLAQGVRA